MNRSKRKSMMEIPETIMDCFLTLEDGPILESDLKERGVDPRNPENYFRVICFCQSEIPRLSISERKGRFLVTIESEELVLDSWLH
jgi:hypothetical protein